MTDNFGRSIAVCTVLLIPFTLAGAQQRAPAGDWIRLFNGRDLTGWTVKIAKHPVGENFGDTFRVVNGVLAVNYTQYDAFDGQFGHLFYNTPYSYYHIVVEYRFIGPPQRGAPEWAYRNNGIMIHSQDPHTMRVEQDFPISVEFQLLGGLSDGKPRPTGNMCSPGTDVDINGAMARSHCVNSTSRTYDGDQWVTAEAIVLGDSLITHIVDGDTVMRYTKPRIGGGTVSGYDPAVKRDGTPLTSGYIALQSEGHATEFRRVELLNLKGCANPRDAAYRAYFVASDPAACKGTK
jgi:hypothetical protein